MNIHEYQAKSVLKSFGVPVPNGVAIDDLSDLETKVSGLSGWPLVVKAQIHAGGRGKAGGVKVCKDLDAVKTAANDIMGKVLVTPQTGPEGKEVKQLWIEEGSAIDKEFYFSIVLDRETSRIIFMTSTEGGMEIEEVAEENPDAIFTLVVHPTVGFQPHQARQIAFNLGLPNETVGPAVKFFMNCYKTFMSKDASTLEVNPLVLTKDKTLVALDCKMNFDDNGLYRQQDIADFLDPNEEDPRELEANKYDLSYVGLDGEIGCLVNGAGLAMATMDIIKYYGKEPANFLDVGGGANEEKVKAAFKIIMSDANVKAILVNIFGGIMKCDIIARGLVAATKELNLSVPIVARLSGTNVELGKQVLAESGLKIVSADTMSEAAEKICSMV